MLVSLEVSSQIESSSSGMLGVFFFAGRGRRFADTDLGVDPPLCSLIDDAGDIGDAN